VAVEVEARLDRRLPEVGRDRLCIDARCNQQTRERCGFVGLSKLRPSNLEVDGRPPIRISERLDEFVNRALTRRVLDKKRLEVAP
jgi:hypothetical protein